MILDDEDFVEQRISDGKDPIVDVVKELLPAACKNGDEGTVKLLLFYGIDAGMIGSEVGFKTCPFKNIMKDEHYISQNFGC